MRGIDIISSPVVPHIGDVCVARNYQANEHTDVVYGIEFPFGQSAPYIAFC